jgi:hypothetical protein
MARLKDPRERELSWQLGERTVEIYTSKEKQFKIILTQNILERVSGFFTR